MRVVASWCVLFTSIAGCAPMLRAEQVIDTPLPEQVSRQPEAGSATIDADAAIAGDRLIVTLVRSRTCLEVTTPRVARTRHVTRRPDPKWMAGTWTLAALAALTGGFAYLDAEGIAAEQRADDPSSTATADDYRAMGMILGAAGLGTAMVAVGNAMRGGDSRANDGEVQGTPRTRRRPCQRTPVTEPVTLALSGETIAATPDANGRAELALTGLPEAALASLAEDVTLSLRDGDVMSVALVAADLAELEEALVANPDSRLSRDRAEARRTACRSAVAAAASAPGADDRPDDVLAAWSAARTRCGALWTADAEAAAGRARPGLLAARERLAAAEAAEEARAALLASLEDLEQVMARGDPAAAAELLAEEPALRTVVRDETRAAAWHMIGDALDGVLLDEPSRAEAEETMCRARAVFQNLLGRAELARGVQRFVRQAGTSDPALTRRVVRALKAGRCR